MRDVIWTVIIVWVIYKLVEMFRGTGQKKSFAYQQPQSNEEGQNSKTSVVKKDVKSAMQKRLDKDGEYVDFEEIK